MHNCTWHERAQTGNNESTENNEYFIYYLHMYKSIFLYSPMNLTKRIRITVFKADKQCSAFLRTQTFFFYSIRSIFIRNPHTQIIVRLKITELRVNGQRFEHWISYHLWESNIMMRKYLKKKHHWNFNINAIHVFEIFFERKTNIWNICTKRTTFWYLGWRVHCPMHHLTEI